MQNFVNIKVNDRLEVEVFSLSHDKKITFKFNRILAQKFADALLQYSGSGQAKMVWDREEQFPAEDHSGPTPAEQAAYERAKSAARGPVRLSSSRRGGSVRY